MDKQLKCFLSASYDTDITGIESVLVENEIEILTLYDSSIGSSIQDILKRKLRQADFAIFVLTKENKNILYEIGVSEGLGKQSLLIFDKEVSLPFYLENKLSLSANLNDRAFIKMSLLGFIDEVRSKRKRIKTPKKNNNIAINTYGADTLEVLNSLLDQVKRIRNSGQGRELEYIVEEIFKTIRLKYVNNIHGPDSGVDFALWSDKLGRILGNPIIVEVKFGTLGNETFKRAESLIQQYAEKSDARVALLLYIDKRGKRFKLNTSLRPLIIGYDTEDFITDLIGTNFENVVLNSRNKIAHGI